MSQLFSKRSIELLKKAADCFEVGTSPFNDDFLSENHVNLEDCMILSEQIAMILKGFANSDTNGQIRILLLSSDGLYPEGVEFALQQNESARLIKQLQTRHK